MSPAITTWGRVVLLAWVLTLLTACGDSSTDPQPTDTSTATAGDAHTGSPTLVLLLPGPTLDLLAPAMVHVRLAGKLHLSAHYGAVAAVAIALAEPVATGPSARPVNLAPPADEPLAYEVWLQLPAGTHVLAAQVTVRATDAAGVPTGALAVADATVDWHVQVQVQP